MAHSLTVAEQIAILLETAATSTHEGEREAAERRAMRLMQKHSIDAATARAAGQAKEEEVGMTVLPWTGGYAYAVAVITNQISAALGCRMVYYTSRTAETKTPEFRIYGFQADRDMAAQLSQHVAVQALALAGDYWARNQHRMRVSAQAAKKAFMLGVATQVSTRLAEEKKAAVAETPGSALVLRDRSADVDRYMRRNVPTRSSSLSVGSGTGHALDSGRNANIDLHTRTGVSGARRAALTS